MKQEKDSDQDVAVDAGLPEFPSKSLNKQIAVISTLAAVGLFLSTRLDFGVSLKDLTAAALPYEEVCPLTFLFFISAVFIVVCEGSWGNWPSIPTSIICML